MAPFFLFFRCNCVNTTSDYSSFAEKPDESSSIFTICWERATQPLGSRLLES